MAAAYQCDRCKKFGAYDILTDRIGDGGWHSIPSHGNPPMLMFCAECFAAFTVFMRGDKVEAIGRVTVAAPPPPSEHLPIDEWVKERNAQQARTMAYPIPAHDAPPTIIG